MRLYLQCGGQEPNQVWALGQVALSGGTARAPLGAVGDLEAHGPVVFRGSFQNLLEAPLQTLQVSLAPESGHGGEPRALYIRLGSAWAEFESLGPDRGAYALLTDLAMAPGEFRELELVGVEAGASPFVELRLSALVPQR